jgi:hypothetical protein
MGRLAPVIWGRPVATLADIKLQVGAGQDKFYVTALKLNIEMIDLI